MTDQGNTTKGSTPASARKATTYYVGQDVRYHRESGWFVSSINMAKGESLAPGSKVASLTITNRTTAPWGEVTLTHAQLDEAIHNLYRSYNRRGEAILMTVPVDEAGN